MSKKNLICKYFQKIRKKNLFILTFILFVFNIFFFKIDYISEYFWEWNDNVPIIFEKPDESIEMDKENCVPIFRDYKHYTVLIDNKIYPQSMPLYANNSINFECLNRNKRIKKILFWTQPSWYNSDGLGKITPFKNQNCPVTNCELTSDITQLYKSDLIIIHMRDKIRKQPKRYRSSSQRWVFMLYESPIHSDNYEEYNGFFNLSSTYKIDSDFPGFYESMSSFVWKLNETFDENFDFSSSKTELAAAMISNCVAPSRRLKLITELQKYLSVEIFGKCGRNCPNTYDDEQPGDCREIIGNTFKFFFAFENSVCEDYITEKFFEVLKFNIIPVVLGGGSYSYYIPPSGYINVLDFKSPKDLADYLLYLDENSTAYNSYFKWKKHISFIEKPITPISSVCEMCIKLHLESYFGIENKIIHDVGSLWNKKGHCNNFEVASNQIYDLY